MKTPLWLSLTLLFSAIKGVFAQNVLPPVFELTSDTAQQYQMDGNYSQILEDPESKYTIEQVASFAFNHHFHANKTKEKGIEYQIKTYWLRFRLHNNLNKEVTLHFTNQFDSLKAPVEYFCLYFQKSNGKWIEQKNGLLVPWSQRAGTKAIPTISIQLLPQQELTFYMRLSSSFLGYYRPKYLNITFSPALSFYKKAYTNNLEGGNLKFNFIRLLFIGIFISTILFSLYNYILIKEKAYLYYLLFLFFYSLVQFPQEYWFLLVPEHPKFFYYGDYVFWILVHAFLVQFIREYLTTRLWAPYWDKLLIMSVIFMTCYGINYYLTFTALTPLYDLIILFGRGVTFQIVVFTIALTIIHLNRNNYPPAKFLLLTLAPFLFIWSVVDFVRILYSSINYILNGRVNNPLDQINFFFYAEFFTTFWMVIFFSTALTRRYTQAQKAIAEQELEKERLEKEKEIERSQLIQAQKIKLEEQVAQRTADLQSSLQELKETQDQLLQREKMASLGELTAGIAHEIQNPLNFVNNFSEISEELCLELEQETKSGNTPEILSLTSNLKQNLKKISHHGKRADSIVKNMLQHSRVNKGEKQATNINALADEYLRLSYYGLRAKDKDFNANLITEFDSKLAKIEVVLQELGRVLLNLFNNAFYATQQKKAQLNGQYKPEIKVSTCQENGHLKISVRDNGTGFLENIKHKIFQPFFTTKPTGQGTGLGLSLSYDIVTKGHGGELKVETEPGVFTEFIIILPHPAEETTG